MKKFEICYQPCAGGATTLRHTVTAATGTEAKAIIDRQFPGGNVMTVEEVLPFHSPSLQMPLFTKPETLPIWGTLGT